MTSAVRTGILSLALASTIAARSPDWDYGIRIAVDSQDYSYTVGGGSSTSRWTLTKAAPNGAVVKTLVYRDRTPKAVAVDREGNVYVSGANLTDNIVSGGGLNACPYNQISRSPSVYVSKLDSRLEQELFTACFFGGAVRAITLDSEGAIYIAGVDTKYLTTTTGALRTAPDPDERSKGFVTKLDGAGRRLIYSTYFGGDGANDRPSISGTLGTKPRLSSLLPAFATATASPMSGST